MEGPAYVRVTPDELNLAVALAGQHNMMFGSRRVAVIPTACVGIQNRRGWRNQSLTYPDIVLDRERVSTSKCCTYVFGSVGYKNAALCR